MKVLVVVVALLGALVATYVIAYPTYTFRYLLTVEVEVSGIVKSGSSVIEVRWATIPPFIPLGIGKEFETTVRGEAVYV